MESPLEVLSRAATMMVQDTANESKLSNKELPTTKWRRDRRQRASEYHHTSNPHSFSNCLRTSHEQNGAEAPLDMTLATKPRTPPPPYREPLPGSIFACTSNRPSVITQAPSKKPSPDGNKKKGGILERESISMCDPVIEEHFRRSLGEDYMSIFKNINNKSKSPPETPLPIEEDEEGEEEEQEVSLDLKKIPSPPQNDAAGTDRRNDEKRTKKESIEFSVDDHFSKALGDTWKKIKENNGGIPQNNFSSNNSSNVSNCSSDSNHSSNSSSPISGSNCNKKDSIRPCINHLV